MNKSETVSLLTLFEDFTQLSYTQKLEGFHAYFGMVPFYFPPMDVQISWFYEEPRLLVLADNLYGEIRSPHLYEKSFTENKKTLLFDIKPRSQSQRIQYNTFLLSLFSSEPYTPGFCLAEETIGTPDEALSFLNTKCRLLRSALADVKQYLQSRNLKPGLKHQFARVFYAGFLSFTSDAKINLRIRHKFVEIYLYSQVILVARHLHHLQHLLRKIDMDVTDPCPSVQD